MAVNIPPIETAAERLYHGEEALALGDIGPYELIELPVVELFS